MVCRELILRAKFPAGFALLVGDGFGRLMFLVQLADAIACQAYSSPTKAEV